jgi:hypothetical protein
MERTRLTGLSIALVRGGDVVWAKGYGVADIGTGEPVVPETLCGIMSVTKPLIGTAIVQLRDAGNFELDIDQPASPGAIKNEWEGDRRSRSGNLPHRWVAGRNWAIRCHEPPNTSTGGEDFPRPGEAMVYELGLRRWAC